MKLKNHTYKIYKIIVLVILLFLSPSTSYSKKINVCGTDSIWRAYIYNNRVIDEDLMFSDAEYLYRNYPQYVDKYYPEEFFTYKGGCIPPYYDNYDKRYIVPFFDFNFLSCPLDSFYIEINTRFADVDYFPIDLKVIALLSLDYGNDKALDFNEILENYNIRMRDNMFFSVNSNSNKSSLRYGNVSKLWYKYKDGVYTDSNGRRIEMIICRIERLSLTWNYYGGLFENLYLKIDEDEYYEDFRDCSNAMVYNDCPPKEPDRLKVICEQIPDCRNKYYKFYTESNLDELHWVSLDGLSHDGDKLTLPLEEFNGGCIGVWGQRDLCSEPLYDTICPPLTKLNNKETDVSENICWNEPFFVNGKRVTESGYYSGLFKTTEGCDSIVNYNINVTSGDTTLKDTVYRCGMEFAPNDMYLYDTIDVAGSCPDLQMHPIGIASDDHHVTISKVKEETDGVYLDVSNNIGDVTYTTIWNGNESGHKKDGYIEFDKFGTYTIIAYDEETGCKDSISVDYNVLIKPDPYFCPDNSGDNKWHVAGLEKFGKFKICIYDRFGKRLVCYDDKFDGWDGTYQGHPMPSTDYWYTIEVIDINYNTSGHFTLYRFDN